jgi:signal transduction histidine kinase
VPVGSVRRELPDATSVDWPQWVGYGCAGLMVLLAGVAASDPAVPHRGWLALAVLVASTGWLAIPLGWWMPPVLHAALVLGIIGLVNADLDPFGFYTADGHEQLTFLVVIFLVGQAMGHWPLRLAGIITVVAVVLASPPVTAHDEISGVWIGAIGLAALVGILIRALLSTILDLEAAQAALSERAAVEERHRIAREVHDVIAHSLTVTMLHLTAARLAIGRGDDAGATEALDEAERAGRSSLADVRRTVGLLRSDDGMGFGTAPAAPHGGDVAGLVAGYRAAGMTVELEVDGDLGAVPADAGIAVYRTVQEALANAARHTPGARSVVSVAVGPVIAVRVRTTGGTPLRQPGVGAGLLGMRERAEALGGWGDSGPDGDSWLVEVELPVAPTSEAVR